MTKRLATMGGALMLATGMIAAAAPAAHAVLAPLDPTNYTVACDSLVGTIAFKTALTLAPDVTDNTITVKAVTSGCTVPDDSVANGAAPGVNGGNASTPPAGDPEDCVQPTGPKVVGGAGGHTTALSTAISGSAAFTPADVGQLITDTLHAIPANTLVTAQTGTAATLSQAATLTETADKFTVGLGTPNQPCVNLAPATLVGTLNSKHGSDNFYNTAADGHTTNASTAISCASCNFNVLQAGNSITDGPANGTIIPAGDTIASVTNATHAVLAVAAIATSTTVHFAEVDSSGCLGLSGLSTGTSGQNVTEFKNQAKGLDNTTLLPHLIDGAGNAYVTSTINSTYGTTYSSDSWGASYGEFQIGTVFGTNPASRTTGAFRGSDNGAGDVFDGTTGQSSGAILIQCLTTGVKTLNFGIGHVTFS